MKQIRSPRHDPADRPLIVIWEATQACPLACRHCRAEARPNRDPGELTTVEACGLMAQVAEFGSPPPLFVITGGDPFQRPDLFELVRHGTRLGLPVAVSPSGTPTLTKDGLTGLREAGARAVSLSLDGSDARVHDAFRATPGVYRWTLDAWQAARDLGLKVQINTTVTGHNLTDLPEIVRIVRQMGALTWSAFLLVPTGRGRLLPGLDPHQVEDVLNFVYDAGAFVPARTTEAHHFRRIAIQRAILSRQEADHVAVLGLGPLYQTLRHRLTELDLPPRRARRPPMDVGSARGFAFVSHRGTVHPSGFLPTPAGNVRHDRLTDIYRTSPLFTGLRDPGNLTGRCGACEFRTICGGSRSRAQATSGDPYAEEPWCAYEPGSFPYEDELASYGVKMVR
ncbi:TIGR04053 family radical SAM/SPASM domain-containing protein [Actinomadura madurae]|uniref:TIGR04053 family radical SAM/SPASM domain-containing protein n=1 Tax=Actinomadura madurae TaxID=1993 RepID=UPI002025CC15|nr:TIGR04053 family radical SAM/SPASM domain-containing protein [Actinomadura madurae]URN03239.1 TIGR04053 family radical SAM/SPASM domain-containing protein [Actinomadura madurae]